MDDRDNNNSKRMIPIARVGYQGRLKVQVESVFNTLFGGSWSKRHVLDGSMISRDQSLQLYEDAYFEFLQGEPVVLDWLIHTASDVYDNAQSNIASGRDYSIQEMDATHLQDIAIRRCLDRMGLQFKGDHLVEIRGRESEGYRLNPGRVPFHKREYILQPARRSWWDVDSIEDFWQSNKVLVADPNSQRSGAKDGLYLFCVHDTTLPVIDAIKVDSGMSTYHHIEPPYDSSQLMTAQEFFEGSNWTGRDVLLRSGRQLPRRTLRTLRRKHKNVVIIS